VTLEDNGAAAGANVVQAADDTTLSVTNHQNYPLGDFVLAGAFAALVTSGAVYLYRQDLNIDGENDAPDVSATSGYEHTLVGVFAIPTAGSATTGTLYYPCVDVPLTKECKFWIKNATNQTLNAGWDLKVTPKTYAPGA